MKTIKFNKNTYIYICNSEEFLQNKSREQLTNSLPNSEQIKYHKYHKDQDKRMFLCSRMILRTELNEKLNLNFNFPLSYSKFHKPYLKDYPNFHFNISHSADYVVLAFSNKPVGIDIEKIVNYKKDELLKYSEMVFHKSEIEYLQTLDNNIAKLLFTKLWTMKESVIKKTGLGFYYDTKFILFAKSIALKTNRNYNEITSNYYKEIKIYSFLHTNNFVISLALDYKKQSF